MSVLSRVETNAALVNIPPSGAPGEVFSSIARDPVRDQISSAQCPAQPVSVRPRKRQASFPRLIAFSIPLLLIGPLVLAVHLLDALKKKIVGKTEYDLLKDEIKLYVARQDQAATLSFLKRRLLPEMRAQDLQANPLYSLNFILDLLAAREVHTHLHEFLKGANIRICNDRGEFFNKWERIHGTYKRRSSHSHLRGKSCGMIGKITSDFHFWQDRTGTTRFQIEPYPLKGRFLGFGNKISHLYSTLKYFRDKEQQGLFGTSPHTHLNCIDIEINMAEFNRERTRLLNNTAL